MFNKILTNFYCVLLISLTAITASQLAFASPEVADFKATYRLARNGFNVGEMKRSLQASGNGTYIFESYSAATGFISLFVGDKIVERSTWVFVNDQPQPVRYTYNRKGGREERHIKLTFDWNEGIVTNTINNDPWKMHIPPQTQDKLLYQLTLMIDLKAGKEKIHYEIADGGKLKDYEFITLGEEQIDTPLGKLDTIKIMRTEDIRKTTIWCAKTLDYLPVRIQQVDKDKARLVMMIHDVSGLPAINASASPINTTN